VPKLRKPKYEKSLAVLRPDIAAIWHYEKNYPTTPEDVGPGSRQEFYFHCRAEGHVFHRSLNSMTNPQKKSAGCNICTGTIVLPEESFGAMHPELKKEWSEKNKKSPYEYRPVSGKTVWWKCLECGVEYEQKISRRTSRGYKHCGGKRPTKTINLAVVHPDIAKDWHYEKNHPLTPEDVMPGSSKIVWWKCPKLPYDPDHDWLVSVNNRTSNKTRCPSCFGNELVTKSNNLAARYPDIAKDWHYKKNHPATPNQVRPGSHDDYWWKCPKNPIHEWEASPHNRTSSGSGCNKCAAWTMERIIDFVKSLPLDVHDMDKAELFVLYQQAGIVDSKYSALLKNVVNGASNIKSVLNDDNIDEVNQHLKEIILGERHDTEIETGELATADNHQIQEAFDAEAEALCEHMKADEYSEDGNAFGKRPPSFCAKQILNTLDNEVFASIKDADAIKFFISSAVGKFWAQVYRAEQKKDTFGLKQILKDAEAFKGGQLPENAKQQFLDEYKAADNLEIPSDYRFKHRPSLMQKHCATKVRDQKRVGNWSGTGSGKTIAAILGGRISEASLTLIVCPNAIKEDGWEKNIKEAFPRSQTRVATTNWNPNWNHEDHSPRYLIVNFEKLQQKTSGRNIEEYLKRETPDFIVIDEIHLTKQRTALKSIRRANMDFLIHKTKELNPNIRVLGMSATPVINNLIEAKSLIQLVSGLAYDELKTKENTNNCIMLYRHLTTLGMRYKPDYSSMEEDPIFPEIELNDEELDELKNLPRTRRGISESSLEQLLTRVKVAEIIKHINKAPRTLIYTGMVTGITEYLKATIESEGFKVGLYTGTDKSGLRQFLANECQVLIGSEPISTGVDGLQNVCDQLIVTSLPWTNAEYEQLKGRLVRQGQKSKVKIIIPRAYYWDHDKRMSFCEYKWQTVTYKKAIADATVDGIIPEFRLDSRKQARQYISDWIARLESQDEFKELPKNETSVVYEPIHDGSQDEGVSEKQSIDRKRVEVEFNTINLKLYRDKSSKTHERLRNNPKESLHYHRLLSEYRKHWIFDPVPDQIKRLNVRKSSLVIGDFGCGMAAIEEALKDQHKVYSFDHVSVNDNSNTIECDMSHVDLPDGHLDIAIFCTSLMGSNYGDYLKEAYRTLKQDGRIEIYEAESKFGSHEEEKKLNIELFIKTMGKLGFQNTLSELKGVFMHLTFLKENLIDDYKSVDFRRLRNIRVAKPL